jgi:hypothetical protein
VGKRINSWIELFQSLRDAFIGVMEAEVQSLRLDFELTKRHIGQAVGFAALAVFVCFWVIGVLVLLLIQVASIWLPDWVASLLVLAFLCICGMGLVAAARRRLRRIEAPKAMLTRHVQEHMDWWEDEVLPASEGAESRSSSIAESSRSGDQESS